MAIPMRTTTRASALSARDRQRGRSGDAVKKGGEAGGLTAAQLERLARLAARPDGAIDLSDQQEITDWSGAVRGEEIWGVLKQLSRGGR